MIVMSLDSSSRSMASFGAIGHVWLIGSDPGGPVQQDGGHHSFHPMTEPHQGKGSSTRTDLSDSR
jgi:hypothetical protein